jgi:hypothetical protein
MAIDFTQNEQGAVLAGSSDFPNRRTDIDVVQNVADENNVERTLGKGDSLSWSLFEAYVYAAEPCGLSRDSEHVRRQIEGINRSSHLCQDNCILSRATSNHQRSFAICVVIS